MYMYSSAAENPFMQHKYATKLESLGFKLPKWCLPPSEALVCEFEIRFSLNLPPDYRDFLVHYGGVVGDAACPFQEPTPHGHDTLIDKFYGFTSPNRHDNVLDQTELIDGAPDVIGIGGNVMGEMFWLKCCGWDAGHVYMHDGDSRSAWPDELFYKRFPNLSPEIQHYLVLRRQGNLPKKRKGYEHVYRLAESFGDFIDRLEPSA